MARITSTDVEKLIEVDSAIDIDPFIEMANALIDETILSDYTETYLSLIETWLSAHFVALRQRQLSNEQLGEIGVTYAGQFGQGLDFTQYGQQVKLLDWKGQFSKIGKKVISFTAL